MANTVLINRVQVIPTPESDKGIYLYSDPDSATRGIYVVANGVVTNMLQSVGGGSGGDTNYSNAHKLITKVGGLDEDTDLRELLSVTGIFNRMFFPNFGKTFPSSPIYFGFTESLPTISSLLQLSSPFSYYDFEYSKYLGEGYLVIALPNNLYLKRIEDANGMNTVNCFDLTYKPVQLESFIDIYNVYISPKLFYNKEVRLSFTTKPGLPVQTKLNSGRIVVNDVIPVLSSIKTEPYLEFTSMSIQQATRSKLESMVVGMMPILSNISISSGKSTLEKISISSGRSVLESIKIEAATRSVLESINISELPILSQISISEGSSKLISMKIEESFDSILESISITSGKSSLLSIKIESFNLEYNYNNDLPSSAIGDINISASYPSEYELYWADDNGPLLGMDKIDTISSNTYPYSINKQLVSGWMIPEDATRLLVRNRLGVSRILEIPMYKRFNPLYLGTKLYSFGLVSDIHCGADISDNISYALTKDVPKSWQYFDSKNVNFICGVGDIEDDDIDSQIVAFSTVMNNNNPGNLRFYTPKGNNDYHLSNEFWYSNLGCTEDTLLVYGDPANDEIVSDKSFSTQHRFDIPLNDVFFFQSVNRNHKFNPLETTKRNRLESILAANSGKRIFYFMHMPMDKTSGDVNEILGNSYPQYNTEFYTWFMSLMSNNKNVICFTGHTHFNWESVKFDPNSIVYNGGGSYGWMIHVPSLGNPRVCTTENSYNTRYDKSQGAIVDVYENYIVINGIDFGTLNSNGTTYDIEMQEVPAGKLLLKTN